MVIYRANKKGSGITQIKSTTFDLEQAADTYDLLTTINQTCILKSLVFRMPNIDASDDASLTSISIVTDDVTPIELITTTQGAVANLVPEFQIVWSGNILLKVGTKLKIIIAGGAADESTICDIVTEYISTINNGYLS